MSVDASAAHPRRIPPAALLLATSGVMALLGRAHLAILGVGVAIVGQQLAWLYPDHARRAAHGVDAGVARLGHLLATVLFGTVHLLLVVPAWALSGRRSLRRTASWHRRPDAPEAPRRLHTTIADPLTPRHLAIDAAVGAALVLGAVALVRAAPVQDATAGPLVDRATATAELPPALADQPLAPEVLGEQGALFADRLPDDELGWVLGDSTGSLVEVRDGERITPVPAGAGEDPLEVWFFGGSLTWGLGVGDDATIPARFAARATEDGRPVVARNFAVPAYLIDQSSELFVRELARQPRRPDLVVFLDGYNEMYGGMASTLAGVAPGAPFTAYGASGAAGTGEAYDGPPASLDERYEGVLTMHARGRERARRAAEAAGVPVVFAWQPNAHSRTEPAVERGVLHELGWSDAELADLHVADRELRRRLPEDVIDLGDAFDTVEQPIYWDTVHVNEVGADRVAQALLVDLSGRLDSLEGDR
jgi:lysophospholipase L1-like esterase